MAERLQEMAREPRSETMFLNQQSATSMLLTHRIQAWDIHSRKHEFPPDISDASANLVVKEAKIHNDASVDFSQDGTVLVTLVPSVLPMTTVVGVYGLSPATRGQCFATCDLESPAVSVSLSPTARNLMVGLSSRASRMSLSPRDDRSLMAQIFKIKLPTAASPRKTRPSPRWPNLSTPFGVQLGEGGGDLASGGQDPMMEYQRGRLIHRQDIPMRESGQTSLNCIRWLPVAGQGIVYATNTGLLKILR